MKKCVTAFLFLIFTPFLVAQQTMNNDAIVKMAKAGLSDDVIITTINATSGTYNTSADAIVALKTAGVSDKVIAAIVLKSAGLATPAPAATPTPAPPAAASSGLPPGITDVGVYYKDKTGAWVPMMSEIVNFKSGGLLKSIATVGIIKGDVNGMVAGKSAKITANFPVVLAVYLAEGVDITEFQLLRLHVNNDSREFRSVTGGVLHSSGGADRDALEFQPEKVASRVYQISLQAGLGKGEYGLLPPGSMGSGGMASSGKIYAISIIE